MAGSSLFNRYFKDWDIRTLVLLGSCIRLAMQPLSFVLIFRKNLEWGIPDMALFVFDDIVGDIISQAFIFLPMTVLFAKITPPHIEATCFAFLASASNSSGIIGGMTGQWINRHYVGVTQEDLSGYWKLASISCACSLIPFVLRYYLIPSKTDIEALQVKMQGDGTSMKED